MTSDESFTAFVATHSTALYRTAYLLTGNAGRAEDLVQETLTRLYPRWDRVIAADSPIAYVRRSLANGFVTSLPVYAALRLVAGVGLAGELGAGITLVSESTRAAWSFTWLEQFLQDVRYALRTMLNNKAFTALAAASSLFTSRSTASADATG